MRQAELQAGPPRATLDQVVTFNGAGVGEVRNGTLSALVDRFVQLRGLAFGAEGLSSLFLTLKGTVWRGDWTATINRDPVTQAVIGWLGRPATMSGNISATHKLGDALYGGAGDDVMESGGANDFLKGGSGNDHLFADRGSDYLDGVSPGAVGTRKSRRWWDGERAAIYSPVHPIKANEGAFAWAV